MGVSAFRVSAAMRAARPRPAIWLVSACAILAAMPAAAGASTVSVSPAGSELVYSSSGGSEVNRLQVTRTMGGVLFVFNDGVSITATAPCLRGATARSATCPADRIRRIDVYGGLGDDSLDLSVAAAPATLLMGGAGDDNIKGGAGIDNIAGEEGDDTLDGAGGSDTVNGGLGADTIAGGPDPDQLACGDDAVVDTVSNDSSDGVSTDCANDTLAFIRPPDSGEPPSSPTTSAGSQGAAVAPGARALTVLSPFPIVRLRGAVTRTGARIELLAVRAPRGSRVSVRCRGRGCPARRASAAAGRGLKFERFQRHLRAGIVLEVRVTRLGRVGKYVRFTIRKGKSPLRRDMCLKSTGARPVRCSSV